MNAMEIVKGTLTPLDFALTATKGRYQFPGHLRELNRHLVDCARNPGRRKIVTMPPRHGKSELCSKYFPAWFRASFPDKRVILASYEASFASSWGRHARNLVSEYGPDWFGVQVADTPAKADNWEIARRSGAMYTAGVGGPITGKGADILIVDDPIKNAAEAASKTLREHVWDWFTSTALTRLEPGGSVILIQTRWHQDDLAGRLLREYGDRWELVKFPAIDSYGRALWPERFSVQQLEEIRSQLGGYFWASLYQQDPIDEGGTVFQREWFQIVDALPAGGRLKSVRYCDKAGSDTNGDFSAFVLMVECDGIFYIADVVHGRWSPFERNQVMLQTAELDSSRGIRDHTLWIEQEPGNGGKESALISGRELRAFGPRFEVPSVDKVLRSRHFAAQAEAGNVRVLRADWNAKLIDELVHFPHGEHDDMVDGCSGAFNKIVLKPKSPSGVGVVGVRSKYVGT